MDFVFNRKNRRPTDDVADRTPPNLAGPTIKVAVFVGFAVTSGIWLLAGYYFTGRMAELERRSTEINARYTRAQNRLAAARAQILLGSVYVRDALLDPDPTSAGEYRRQLEDAYRTADRALQRYEPVLDAPAERQRVQRLRAEIDEFRNMMLQVLETDSHHWPREARTLLRTQIVPKREAVLRVSEDVQALNRSAFIQQQTESAGIYRAIQRRVWETLGLSLAASLGVALLAIVYASGLEGRIRRQRLKDVQNAHDLQRLSTKLITAQEEERRSIARELHDEVGQVLTAIKVELAVAQRSIEASGGSADVLKDARSIADGALHTVRDLSHLLHPALLDDLGLPAAIDWYLKGFSKRYAIRVELLHDRMDDRLGPETEAAAYRIVQEALTNVVKHAQATACRVYLQRLPNTVLLTIEDNGAGFEPSAANQGPNRGLGLIGIRERVSQLQGTVRLETAPGRGTRLTVELPACSRTDRADAQETPSILSDWVSATQS
jgi:signal transduction histidine kinase